MSTFATVAEHLRPEGEQRITAQLNDRISRAFLLDDEYKPLVMDYNAHLITELRVRRIWPHRDADPKDPCQ